MSRKKKLSWHSVFGEITVVVQRFLLCKKCQTPFSDTSGAHSRSYSLPLQRAITDFGADTSFGQVEQKLKEHYGISLPTTSIQKITKQHARQISEEFPSGLPLEAEPTVKIIIGETDGTMVPIVKFKEKKDACDRRKRREVCWKEARLSFARAHQSLRRIFAATLGSTEVTGDQLFACAEKVGMGLGTHVHCVGDGARWIREQVDRVFADQGSYLIDFYHLSEYLSKASERIPKGIRTEWLKNQKEEMKKNRFHTVLYELEKRIVNPSDKECPLQVCHRYISNCRSHLDYHGAKEKELPIGSGEIESSHRTVIQKRLKIPGAWWLPETAETMLALRCSRLNGAWEDYWSSKYNSLEIQAA